MTAILSDTGATALECVHDILESYMEFVDIMERTLAKCDVPKKIKPLADALIRQRRADWQPILDKITLDLEKNKESK